MVCYLQCLPHQWNARHQVWSHPREAQTIQSMSAEATSCKHNNATNVVFTLRNVCLFFYHELWYVLSSTGSGVIRIWQETLSIGFTNFSIKYLLKRNRDETIFVVFDAFLFKMLTIYWLVPYANANLYERNIYHILVNIQKYYKKKALPVVAIFLHHCFRVGQEFSDAHSHDLLLLLAGYLLCIGHIQLLQYHLEHATIHQNITCFNMLFLTNF